MLQATDDGVQALAVAKDMRAVEGEDVCSLFGLGDEDEGGASLDEGAEDGDGAWLVDGPDVA